MASCSLTIWLLEGEPEKQREHILFHKKIQINVLTPVSYKALEKNIQERFVKNEF